jgi:hypothetical protein
VGDGPRLASSRRPHYRLIRWRGGKGFNKSQPVRIASRYRRPAILGLPIDVIPWLYKFVEFAIERAPFVVELNAKPSVRKLVGHSGDLSMTRPKFSNSAPALKIIAYRSAGLGESAEPLDSRSSQSAILICGSSFIEPKQRDSESP